MDSALALVTGGAGFIGSHLVEALLAEGYRVRVVDNLATGRLSNLAHLEGRFEWIEGTVADFAVCRRSAEGVDYVFHLAAIPSVPRSVREPLASHESGPTATINMLEAARLAGASIRVRGVQQRLRRQHRVAETRIDVAPTAEPLCRREAGR